MVALAGGLTAALTTAAAAQTIYDCSFEELANNMGWVPTRVILSHEPGAAEAEVNDGFIQEYNGGPMTVKVTKETDGILSLSWKLTPESIRGNEVQVRYDFTIYKVDNRAKIRATPLGYDNNWSSHGSCKVSAG